MRRNNGLLRWLSLAACLVAPLLLLLPSSVLAQEKAGTCTAENRAEDGSCVAPGPEESTSESSKKLSDAAQEELYVNLVRWIRNNGGIFDDRQTIHRFPDRPTFPPQIYASDDIPGGTTLLSVPWELIVHPDDPEAEDLCDTVEALSREYKKGEDSPYAPFLQTLFQLPLLLPDAWSASAQVVLNKVLGNDDDPSQKLPPTDVGRHEAWWAHYCDGDRVKDPIGFQAAMLTVAHRSPGLFTPENNFQEVLIPMLENYGHRSGEEHYNTHLVQVSVGEAFVLAASKDIPRGRPIYMSRGFGEPIDTAELFRDHGMIPEYPQRFILDVSSDSSSKAQPLQFDLVQEKASEYTVDQHVAVYWEDDKKPSQRALQGLQKKLEQLQGWNIPFTLSQYVPVHELELIHRYRKTLIVALTKAIEDAAGGNGVWHTTDFTITDYPVAGVNLGLYGLSLEDVEAVKKEQQPQEDDGSEPFELFQDFDIGHLIQGGESWNEMVKYRQSLQSPTLSFYVDKVARKRWLPTKGYPQVTQYALNYKYELTESGEQADEAERLFELLPNQTDFAAKPTHHSETSGVWLVSYNADTNSTMVSSTARQLVPDDEHTYSNLHVAKGLAKNLHAEAAKHESWVLKNVKPGVVIEERFVDFDRFDRPPLEFCIFTIWGRVWVATMNYVREQERQCGGFVYRNGTMARGSFYDEGIPWDFVDWPELVRIAEELGANKDMFRTDIFVGVPAGSPALREGATLEERKAAVKFAVSECELHPTTVFHTKEITDEGARLWVAGYKEGIYNTVPNTEVPREFVLSGSLSSPETLEQNTKIREECRRYPTWRDHVDEERCAAVTGYNPHRYDLFDGGTQEFSKQNLTWAEEVVACMDEKASERTIDQGPIPEPKIVQMYPPEAPVVLIVENAFSEEEAAVIEDLTMCMQRFHGKSLLEHRSFNYAGTGGNDCTFLGGFLQLFAPGVSSQMYHVGFLGWEAAGWATKINEHDRTGEKYPFPDPRTTGLRTSGHLSYEGWEELGGHADDESFYDVLAVLAAPSDYEGGEFFVRPSTRPEAEENMFRAKPERLSAVVFLSEEYHGVEKITGGLRKTWGNELWKHGDVPVGVLRPRPNDWVKFESTGRFF